MLTICYMHKYNNITKIYDNSVYGQKNNEELQCAKYFTHMLLALRKMLT